jgi:hypothetical protein
MSTPDVIYLPKLVTIHCALTLVTTELLSDTSFIKKPSTNPFNPLKGKPINQKVLRMSNHPPFPSPLYRTVLFVNTNSTAATKRQKIV